MSKITAELKLIVFQIWYSVWSFIFSKQPRNLIDVKEFIFNKDFFAKFFTRLFRNEFRYRNSSSKSLKYLQGKNFVSKVLPTKFLI